MIATSYAVFYLATAASAFVRVPKVSSLITPNFARRRVHTWPLSSAPSSYHAIAYPPRSPVLQKRLQANVRNGQGSAPRVTYSVAATSNLETTALDIHQVPCFNDNYAYILVDPAANVSALVDPADADPVLAELKRLRIPAPTFILSTHHHSDHVGMNLRLKKAFPGVKVVGPREERDRIPGLDMAVGDGDVFAFGQHQVQVLDTPGHTAGHISFYFPAKGALFPGDTLFSLGCGRLFEGTPAMMWESLQKISRLPPHTQVYCAHEYTASNAKFALSVEPQNEALAARAKQVQELRTAGKPTIPSTLSTELAANPFLRPWSKEIRDNLRIPANAEDSVAFGVIRKAKDVF
eukprot:jgi/Mesvir1/23027/Mv03021-RA.1